MLKWFPSRSTGMPVARSAWTVKLAVISNQRVDEDFAERHRDSRNSSGNAIARAIRGPSRRARPAAGRRARLPAGVPAAGGAVRRSLHRPADFVHRRLHRLGAASDRHPGAAQRHPLRNPLGQLVGRRSLQRRALPDFVDHHRLPVRLPDVYARPRGARCSSPSRWSFRSSPTACAHT